MDQAYTLDISSDVGGLYKPLIGPESYSFGLQTQGVS